MKDLLQSFWNEEKGNAIVDWCMLGIGTFSLGFAVVTTLT